MNNVAKEDGSILKAVGLSNYSLLYFDGETIFNQFSKSGSIVVSVIEENKVQV
jgi:hypothetical protein